MPNDPLWLTNFDITRDDLKRLEEWIGKQKRGVTLEELARRIIRGRILYGQDTSPSALPEWVHERHILLWDEIENWCVGCQVLVARQPNDQIVPFIGIINSMDNSYFEIQVADEVVTYGRVKPGCPEAKHYYENIQRIVDQLPEKTDIDEQENIVLLKNGAEIASRIRSALENDLRFMSYHHRWYLQKWIPEINRDNIWKAHHEIWRTTKQATLQQLRAQIPGLPEGGIGDISLLQALSKVPDLFQPCGESWQAVPPPPPPWEKAVGVYYVYDPDTFEIILRPGEPLKKKVAERLTTLGLYEKVVQAKD